MLKELGESVHILEAAEIREEQESPFHADLPEERVGYLRLGSMTADHVSELETALGGMLERKISALVLDLRATSPVAPPEALAQLCRLFCPKGKVLFRLKKPRLQEDAIFTARQEPLYRGPLAVLVGPETEGAAEAAASVLRREGRALLVGSRVPGIRSAFAETVLPGGLTLRVAVGAFEPSGSAEEPGPDLAVPGSASDTRALLALGLRHSAAALIGEPERPRLNEAALVAGLNPELDSGKSTSRKGGPALPVDTALQTAVDLCSTIRAFNTTEPLRKHERTKGH
jgi:C-terminal processing protease CtpA/Prc